MNTNVEEFLSLKTKLSEKLTMTIEMRTSRAMIKSDLIILYTKEIKTDMKRTNPITPVWSIISRKPLWASLTFHPTEN